MPADKSSLYRTIKWIWLLIQCAMPVMAAIYLARNLDTEATAAVLYLSPSLYKFLLIACFTVYGVFWLIAESLLCMYRFPLNLKNAALLVAGFVAQFAVVAFAGESLLLAAYAGLFATFLALLVCSFLLMFAAGRLTGEAGAGPAAKRTGRKAFVVLALFAAAATPLLLLWPPMWSGFSSLGISRAGIGFAALAANVFVTVRTLVDFSVFGRPDPRSDEYGEEWKSWAPQTIGLLILSVVAAILVAGIMKNI